MVSCAGHCNPPAQICLSTASQVQSLVLLRGKSIGRFVRLEIRAEVWLWMNRRPLVADGLAAKPRGKVSRIDRTKLWHAIDEAENDGGPAAGPELGWTALGGCRP